MSPLSKTLFLILLVFSSFLFAQKNLSKENFAKSYQPDAVFLHPDFLIYNQNDSISLLFYTFDYSELKYVGEADSLTFKSKCKIQYSVFSNYEAKYLVDSGSVLIQDSAHYLKNLSQIGQLEMKVKRGASYVLKVGFTDLNTTETVSRIFEIVKSNSPGNQDFYLKASDGLPVFFNAVERDQKFSIVCNNSSVNHFFIRKYQINQTPPPPPMIGNPSANKKLFSDSNFEISAVEGVSDFISFSEQGLYFVSIDSGSQNGCAILRFTKGFPYISSSMQMISSVRYLTTGSEFKQMMNNPDKKKAVDDFWLKITGDEKRAKNQIAIYYNRVQNANKLFSSTQEGWMTDRGMMYIVLGPPEAVYKNMEIETWVYGEANKNLGMQMNFIKQSNPATNNDYLLDRNQVYSNYWNNALEIWRR